MAILNNSARMHGLNLTMRIDKISLNSVSPYRRRRSDSMRANARYRRRTFVVHVAPDGPDYFYSKISCKQNVCEDVDNINALIIHTIIAEVIPPFRTRITVPSFYLSSIFDINTTTRNIRKGGDLKDHLRCDDLTTRA